MNAAYQSERCRTCRRDYLAPDYGQRGLCNDCRFTWWDRVDIRQSCIDTRIDTD